MNVHVTINDDLNDDLVWELFLAVYLHFHEIFSNFGRISYSSRIFSVWILFDKYRGFQSNSANGESIIL